MSDVLPLVIIGAGVIGLATARAAARRGLPALVLEAGEGVGRETSARNSEVIHAGLYYEPGSRKARACVAGRRMLMRYLADRGVPHALPGKLIVATAAEEEAQLDLILDRARAAGLAEAELPRRLTGAEARALEPDLACTAALLSPATGIFDSHAYMLALQGEAEAGGAEVALRAPVLRIDPGPPHVLVGAEGWRIAAERVVIAAGHGTERLMRQGSPFGAACPEGYLLKGTYFLLRGKGPFRHLVYPVPAGGGLGVHLTLDMGGRARFGPDTEPAETFDTTVDPGRAPAFAAAIRRWWPGLPDAALDPGYAGIRPKLKAPPGRQADFVILAEAELGVPGLVSLHGIESPGLTASLALAEEVCERLAGG
jgi:L-2-hydroxyglutarate oxidase LhgO